MNKQSKTIAIFDLLEAVDDYDLLNIEVQALRPDGSYLPVVVIDGEKLFSDFASGFYLPVIKIVARGPLPNQSKAITDDIPRFDHKMLAREGKILRAKIDIEKAVTGISDPIWLARLLSLSKMTCPLQGHDGCPYSTASGPGSASSDIS